MTSVVGQAPGGVACVGSVELQGELPKALFLTCAISSQCHLHLQRTELLFKQFFFSHTFGRWKFLGQGWKTNLCSDNAQSLTCRPPGNSQSQKKGFGEAPRYLTVEGRGFCPSPCLTFSQRAGSTGNAQMPRLFVKGNDTLSSSQHLVIPERHSGPDNTVGSLTACVFFPEEGGGRGNPGAGTESIFSVSCRGRLEEGEKGQQHCCSVR